MTIAPPRLRSPRPTRRPLPPRADRPLDYKMSDHYLNPAVHPLTDVFSGIRPTNHGGMSIHVYGGFIIHHQRLPRQPAQVSVYYSDDGYSHVRLVKFDELSPQVLRDLVSTMASLRLTPNEIAFATGFRLSTIREYLGNEQPI